MSNRHKFRVFDRQFNIYLGERSGMATPCMNGDKGLLNYFDEVVYLPGTKTEKYVIEQCTGHEDKENSLLFEGDIVIARYGYRHITGLICFSEYKPNAGCDSKNSYGFYIKWRNNEDENFRKDFLYWIKNKRIEIVGNINENPELLKGEVV